MLQAKRPMAQATANSQAENENTQDADAMIRRASVCFFLGW